MWQALVGIESKGWNAELGCRCQERSVDCIDPRGE